MKEIIFHNKNIYYKTEGKGNLVFLIHGFAEDNSIWQHQIESLKEKFFLIIPDLPGSGKSEMLEGDIFIEDYADVIKAIADVELKNNNKHSFTIIGHSMGGYIALAFAEKYSDLLSGFGLFHSTAFADDETKKGSRRKGIEFIKNNDVESFLKAGIPDLFSEKTKKENAEIAEKLINNYKEFSAKSLIQYYNAMIKRPDRTSVLQSFQKPVLFIIGKKDKSVLLQSSLKQCHLPSISHIDILKNSAHMGMWEEKEESNDFLFQFLSDLNNLQS